MGSAGLGVGVAVGLGVFVAEPEPEPDPEPLSEEVVAEVVVSPSSGVTITSPSSVVVVVGSSVSVETAEVVSEDVVVSVGTRTSFLLQPRIISAITKMRIRTPAMIERVIVNCFLSMTE